MRIAVVAGFLMLAGMVPGLAAEPTPPGLTIDIPVKLDSARVVFNLDHPAFAGDEPIGLEFLRVMLAHFKADGTKAEIVAIFHGEAGYMLLGDAKYDEVRNWQGGNPYKAQVLAAMAAGASIEECGQTMRDMGWINADMLPGVKINTSANLRIIELVQDGFVQIQP